ncbi:hypothetical protein GCM10023238_10300 [Streptomyces heliomycini]
MRHLTPCLRLRQSFTGAGRVGIGQDGHEHGFQLSQRADYFEVEVGLETTLKRPIINTGTSRTPTRRELPPAARDHRRREPLRDLDVPELGTTGAGPVHDRGRVHAVDLAVDQPVRTSTRSRTIRP